MDKLKSSGEKVAELEAKMQELQSGAREALNAMFEDAQGRETELIKRHEGQIA